ncbi:MAG: DUF2934 domain-containing protein [Candidatus Omnitrophica bacterium]|nr:DUF2934 domain-containing protein [Candidatus Omnitrophota bacterium]
MAEIKKKAVRKAGGKTAAAKSTKSGANNLTIDQALFDEYVRQRAYYLWEEKGKPQGDDMDIWLRAEQDIRAQFSAK